MRLAVCVPTIPPRRDLLLRALASVYGQTRQPDHVSVASDLHREGAPATRNRAWRATDAALVAFLDDDDEMLPGHLETLENALLACTADMAYAWPETAGGTNPHEANFGRPFDRSAPCQTTVTCLWRREALEALGGFRDPEDGQDEQGHVAGEDYDIVKRLAASGRDAVHVPQRTWRWHHHSANTMGLPSRW